VIKEVYVDQVSIYGIIEASIHLFAPLFLFLRYKIKYDVKYMEQYIGDASR